MVGFLRAWVISGFVVVAGFAGEVEVAVSLSPAGSFVAKSSAVKAAAVKTNKGAFLAKDVSLELGTLKTGIALRDKHMMEKYFETQKFPTAVVDKAFGNGGKFKGSLKIRGKAANIEGTYKLAGKTVQVTFPCKMSDFDIEAPAYMGVGADDDVEVKVTLPVTEDRAVTSSGS